MSFGTIKSGKDIISAEQIPLEKPNATEQEKTTVTVQDFESVAYLKPEDAILTYGFKLSPETIGQLNKIIGRLLFKIQEASFVPYKTLDVIPLAAGRHTDFDPPERTFPPEAHTEIIYGTTLSDIVLINAIQNNIQVAVEEAIAAIIDANTTETKTGGTSKTSSNATLQFSAMDHNDFQGKHIALLPLESRKLIDEFAGTGCADAIEAILKLAAQDIAFRAHLSYPSIRRDRTNMYQSPVEKKGLQYSTLNPKDLMAMMENNMSQAGISVVWQLPERKKAEIMNRFTNHRE